MESSEWETQREERVDLISTMLLGDKREHLE
jgi:hypothetical protein